METKNFTKNHKKYDVKLIIGIIKHIFSLALLCIIFIISKLQGYIKVCRATTFLFKIQI